MEILNIKKAFLSDDEKIGIMTDNGESYIIMQYQGNGAYMRMVLSADELKKAATFVCKTQKPEKEDGINMLL